MLFLNKPQFAALPSLHFFAFRSLGTKRRREGTSPELVKQRYKTICLVFCFFFSVRGTDIYICRSARLPLSVRLSVKRVGWELGKRRIPLKILLSVNVVTRKPTLIFRSVELVVMFPIQPETPLMSKTILMTLLMLQTKRLALYISWVNRSCLPMWLNILSVCAVMVAPKKTSQRFPTSDQGLQTLTGAAVTAWFVLTVFVSVTSQKISQQRLSRANANGY